MAIFLLIFTIACSPKPEPIEYGFDACAHCKMTITDHRYGTELVTKKGKVYKFDSVECLVMHMEKPEANTEGALVLVTDFINPGALIDGEESWYIQSKQLPSPMGMNLTAFASEKVAKSFKEDYNGELLRWNEIKDKVGGIPNDETQADIYHEQ